MLSLLPRNTVMSQHFKKCFICILLYMIACMSMDHVHSVGSQGGQKRISDSLELVGLDVT